MNSQNSVNKHRFAYQTIRARILDGSFPPGYRIVIDQLAREFSSSPIPVREAIRQLESEGLIHYKPYSGAIVTPIDENEYVETLSVLAVIEGYATALSSKEIPRDQLSRLSNINNNMKQALEAFDFVGFGDLNREFHCVTYDYCPNRYLVENIKQTWNRLDSIRRVGSSFNLKRAMTSIEEHEQIIELLTSKAPMNVIEDFVRTHKMNTVKSFTEKTRQHPTT